MTKVVQTKKEMEQQLENQLKLLSILADMYDSGQAITAKSMATSIRVLVHDTDSSHSLLGQLNKKGGQFYDSCSIEVISPDVQRVGGFCGLVSVAVGGNHNYVPYLDESPGLIQKNDIFDNYWNRVIFRDKEGSEFTRKNIILAVANQDGGSHVDPNIDEKYKKLTRDNTLGWKVSSDGFVWNNARGAELAAVRQIGHELLRTFKSEYPKKQMVNHGAGIMIGGMGLLVTKFKKVTKIIFSRQRNNGRKIGRNERCPCGSGIKYKKCHGR